MLCILFLRVFVLVSFNMNTCKVISAMTSNDFDVYISNVIDLYPLTFNYKDNNVDNHIYINKYR